MIMMMVVTLLYGLISNIGSNMSSDGGVIGGGFIPTSENPVLWVDFQPTFGGCSHKRSALKTYFLDF